MSADKLTVTIINEGHPIWSYRDGPSPGGMAAMDYISDGTQERIIEALVVALAEARGQLRGAFQVSNVVPYVRPATSQVDDSVPVA